MTWQKAVLGLVLILFLAMTGEVLYEHGYLGFFAIASSNSGTQLMMFDLISRSEGKVFQRIAGTAVLVLLMVAGVAL